jgi:hypothetical protein
VKLNYYCAESVDPAQVGLVREIRDKYVNDESADEHIRGGQEAGTAGMANRSRRCRGGEEMRKGAGCFGKDEVM